MKYTFTVPPTLEQGSYKGTCSSSARETHRQNALSDYNSARAHDGLPPLSRMPIGTTYHRQYEFEIQGLYSGEWECVTTEETSKDAREQLKCYRENEKGTAFRIRRVAL